jgi:predicted small metal-binding protein
MFELRCKDVGFDCAGVVHGSTKEEVLKQAEAHASQVHHIEITPEMAAMVATLIRQQPAKGA